MAVLVYKREGNSLSCSCHLFIQFEMMKVSLSAFFAVVVCCTALRTGNHVATSSLDQSYKDSITKDIIAAYGAKFGTKQWAVLCLVVDPAWSDAGHKPPPNFDALNKTGKCANPVTPGPNKNEHAEPKLFAFLNTHYDYKTLPTILLYTRLSPCSTCGEALANRLTNMAKLASGTVAMDIVYSLLYKIDNPKSPFYDPDGSKMYNANKKKFDAVMKKKKIIITIDKYPK